LPGAVLNESSPIQKVSSKPSVVASILSISWPTKSSGVVKKVTERELIGEKLDKESMVLLGRCNITKEKFVDYVLSKLDMFDEKAPNIDIKKEVIKYSDEYT
jgi:hypothetical protein